MDVVVFGAGSLGSLVGGCLARDHDVTLVGRDPHMARGAADGLRVSGVQSFVVHPHTTTDGTSLDADLAVVTVKAFDTATAADALASGTYDAVLSLQNGMGNEDVLTDRLECAVLAGSVTHGALLCGPGHVEWTGRGEVGLGPWRPAETPLVEAAAAAFEAAGLVPAVEPDIRAALWRKLAVNAAINPVTALARVRNGAVRAGPAADLAREAAREVAAVAREAGVDLADAAAVERVVEVAEATAANRSSMLTDVERGTRTEVDQINGYVVDHAGGVDVPVNRALAGLIREWEAGRDIR